MGQGAVQWIGAKARKCELYFDAPCCTMPGNILVQGTEYIVLIDEIIKHWQSFKNPLINDILINLEKLEKNNPPLTPEEIDAVQAFLDRLSTIPPANIDEKEMIFTLNQLPAAYMLYIIHKMQTLNSDLVVKLINYTQKFRDQDPEIEKFFQRNMVFEKSQLLGRIFSEKRMQEVLDALWWTVRQSVRWVIGFLK